MQIRTLIADDEQLARDELRYLLQSEPDVEILEESSNGIEAVQLIFDHRPDLVFLDVQMPGLDGFAVLKRLIAKKFPLPQIVFATAFDQYAVRAFEVNAIDYLLKPFDRKRVQQAVQKARSRLQLATKQSDNPGSAEIASIVRMLEEQSAPRSLPSRIVVRAQSRLLLVDQKDICFAAIDEGSISVVTPAIEGESNCRTLEELLDSLDPALFWRAHRGFIVNINHIREVVPWFKSSYQLRMADRKHTEIPVSRAQTKRLRELFNL